MRLIWLDSCELLGVDIYFFPVRPTGFSMLDSQPLLGLDIVTSFEPFNSSA